MFSFFRTGQNSFCTCDISSLIYDFVEYFLFTSCVDEDKENETSNYSRTNGEIPAPIEKSKDPVSPTVPGNPLNLPDGVGRGLYFSKVRLPECGFIEVCVTHVIDPHHFWVMTVDNWPKLEALTAEMR